MTDLERKSKASECAVWMHISVLYGWLAWVHVGREIALACWACSLLYTIGVFLFSMRKP